jgi:hypothetical protein
VAGDICENPLDPEAGAELPEGAALPETSNGFVEAWRKPEAACGLDDVDEVSDMRASSADVAAPKASSMAELRQTPHGAALYFLVD